MPDHQGVQVQILVCFTFSACIPFIILQEAATYRPLAYA